MSLHYSSTLHRKPISSSYSSETPCYQEVQELRKANSDLLLRNKQLSKCVQQLNHAYLQKISLLQTRISELEEALQHNQDTMQKNEEQHVKVLKSKEESLILVIQELKLENNRLKNDADKYKEEAVTADLKYYELKFQLQAYAVDKSSPLRQFDSSSPSSTSRCTYKEENNSDKDNTLKEAGRGVFADIMNIPVCGKKKASKLEESSLGCSQFKRQQAQAIM